eukprot:CAMPEP_0197857084 /NCGR_PEP_ID=MMETSP1438-20131217/29842_1 /TAXON_ID=1461541 /ORGANISM="Pterosperma sp., Strain CCMP1384" /LENGTH=49 /DNA_ID= /DNA_START= /DNA_END= /DNA_ORIENTATION=
MAEEANGGDLAGTEQQPGDAAAAAPAAAPPAPTAEASTESEKVDVLAGD